MIADTIKAVVRAQASCNAWTRNKGGDALWAMNVIWLDDPARLVPVDLRREFNTANTALCYRLCAKLGR